MSIVPMSKIALIQLNGFIRIFAIVRDIFPYFLRQARQNLFISFFW